MVKKLNAGDDDATLTSAEAARLAGYTPGDFRSRVSKGTAPQPDSPDQPDVPPGRRRDLWKPSTIQLWLDVKPGPGRPKAGDNGLAILDLPQGSRTRPWAAVDRKSGTILARGRTPAEARKIADRRIGIES
jgi:hypothetical protein